MAMMECSPPRGYPEPTVKWRKDDHLLPMNGRYRLSGTNLQINNVQPEDNGRYQCIAQNMAGSRESPQAQLNVRGIFFFVCYDNIRLIHFNIHHHSETTFHYKTGRYDSISK